MVLGDFDLEHISRGGEGHEEVVEFERCYIAEEELNEQLNAQREEISKRDRGISLRLKEGPHFAQVNNGQNEQMKKVITEWIGEVPHKTVVELYAGSGNFTFPIATVAENVVAVEIDGRAVKAADEYMESKGIENVLFHRLPSDRADQAFPQGQPDIVFLDPPRRGAAEALDAIIDLKPSIIIYMSCDPATMSRDVRKLVESGWKFQKSMPVDMFPQTFHIESLTMLSIGSETGG